MGTFNSLNNIKVASPCYEDWGQMKGDKYSRHCASCQKNVYNLSELSQQQALDLVNEKEGNLCVQFYQRKDGSVLTTDCPTGKKIKRKSRLVRAIAVLTAFMGLSGFKSCFTTQVQGDICPPEHANQVQGTLTSPEKINPLRGEVCPVEPVEELIQVKGDLKHIKGDIALPEPVKETRAIRGKVYLGQAVSTDQVNKK